MVFEFVNSLLSCFGIAHWYECLSRMVEGNGMVGSIQRDVWSNSPQRMSSASLLTLGMRKISDAADHAKTRGNLVKSPP